MQAQGSTRRYRHWPAHGRRVANTAFPGGRMRMACKPDSVPRFRGDDHSSCPAVAGGVMLPTRIPEPKRVRAGSLFGIAPGGACRAGPVASPAVSSCLTVSPLPRMRGRLFSVALSLGFPRPGVTRHRRSVESGLSSKPSSRGHPAIRSALHTCIVPAEQSSRAACAARTGGAQETSCLKGCGRVSGRVIPGAAGHMRLQTGNSAPVRP